jgi:hypothetical protein
METSSLNNAASVNPQIRETQNLIVLPPCSRIKLARKPKTGTTKPYASAKPKTPKAWKQEHTMP